MSNLDTFIAANRDAWDARADLHADDSTGTYRIEAVLAGASVLHEIETSLLGDVAGERILHLQCHIGLDTISLASLGAIATGVDFSPRSIEAARDFARRAGRDVAFVESDIAGLPDQLDGGFDTVFTSWGVLNWLPDLDVWAAVIARMLRPGGRLVLVEGHPLTTMCFVEEDGRLAVRYPWRDPPERPVRTDDAQSYTGDARQIAVPTTYEWTHPIADVATALIGAGLTIRRIGEHDRCAWRAFPMLVPAGGGLWRFPDGAASLPLAYSIEATRPG